MRRLAYALLLVGLGWICILLANGVLYPGVIGPGILMLAGGLLLARRASPTAAAQWIEGALYVSPQPDGTFVPLKILKVDAHGVHIRRYSNVYPAPPAHIDASTLYMAGVPRREDEPLGMGHMPISNETFATWDATFVQQSSVVAEELEGYRMWLEAEGGYF